MQVQPILYTQDDLDKPTRFLGTVADTLNQLITQINGDNPMEKVEVVTLAEALGFQRGQITEADLRARAFIAERPVSAP